ncbi:UBX domain protein Ubx2 [Coemansia sp. RSA 1813]|nr:UBX domain protein Ubx2 [Coemansia sp. RSA 1813]
MSEQKQPEASRVAKKSPTDFLENILGRQVFVRLNSGVDYKGILACLDGYMNIALEQTEEYVEGELRNRYGDAFIRGNNSELIQTFCAATGAEPEVASRYLQVADNNVDNAVMLYFDNGGMPLNDQDSSAAVSDTGATASTNTGADSYFGEDEVRAPIAARSDVLVDGGDGGYGPGFDESIYAPHYGSRMRTTPVHSSIFNQQIARSGLEPFRNFAQEAAEISGEASSSSRAATTAVAGASSRRSRLAELFKPPFDIMHTGNLDSARSEAQEKGKWVIINLQDVSDFMCQALNRDIWRQEIIKDVIKRDFVFFQRSIDTAEGSRLATMYSVRTYPFIAAIHPKTGELKKTFTRIASMADTLEDLTNFIMDNPMARRGKRSSGSEASTSRSASRATTSRAITGIHNMSEEDQLAAAIAASELDSQPAGEGSNGRSGRRVVTIDTDSEPDSEFENSDSYSDIESISSYDDEDGGDDQLNSDGDMDVDDASAAHEKMAKRASADAKTKEEEEEETKPNDPDAWYKELPASEPLEPAQGSTVVRIQFRFPNGQRVVRRFSKFDPVSTIFQYIKATFPGASDALDVPEIMFMNEQLSDYINQTIEEAKLANASLVVDI